MAQLYKGKLEEWDDKKGIGIVKSVHNRKDIILKISSISNYEPLIIGDMLEYNIVRNGDGQDEAVKAKLLPRVEHKKPKKEGNNVVLYSILFIFILLGVILSAGYFTEAYKSNIFKEYFPSIANQLNPPKTKVKFIEQEIIKEKEALEKVVPKEEKIILECTGKTTCSEMRSCGEALYYISNCPNTEKLDKDSNGIPCEDTLCDTTGIEVDDISVNAPTVKDMYTPSNKLKCDGRQYCSQMTSCEEATYFLRNCPNTKMDGDANNIPCERQWCKN